MARISNPIKGEGEMPLYTAPDPEERREQNVGWPAGEFAYLQDDIPEPIIFLEPSLTVRNWNKAAEELFGLSAGQVLGRSLQQLGTCRLSGASRLAVTERLRSGQKWSGELTFTCRSGRHLLLECCCSPSMRKDGTVKGYVVLLRQRQENRVTSTPAAAAVVGTSGSFNVAQLFGSFMENTPTLTWILDENACFRYMNSSYMKVFGLPQDAIGRSIYEFYPQEICDSYVAVNLEVWAANSPMEVMETGLAADGRRKNLQVFKFPLGSDNGVRLIGGTALDITQLIETREALIRSNERYHYAGKATSAAIWDWQIRERKIYRGEGFRALFGCCEEVCSFDTSLQMIHPEDREKVLSSLYSTLDSPDDHWQEEYRFRCLDGSYRTILDKAFIVRSLDGIAVRMIGAMHDITGQRNLERMLLEEEIRKKREIVQAIMEAQEKERKEISSELHDNVNQILTTCKLFLEIARNNPQDTRFIDACYSNIQTVISEIRNISHNLSPYALKDLGFVTAIHDLTDKINQSGKLIINIGTFDAAEEEKISPEIKLVLFRIIQEKISNVLKHSGATTLEIDIRISEGRIYLVLADNGQGFDQRVVKKGLGLNNIRNRVDYYRGSMEMKTSPGMGCELRIELPVG